jgi:hypothetical protein
MLSNKFVVSGNPAPILKIDETDAHRMLSEISMNRRFSPGRETTAEPAFQNSFWALLGSETDNRVMEV